MLLTLSIPFPPPSRLHALPQPPLQQQLTWAWLIGRRTLATCHSSFPPPIYFIALDTDRRSAHPLLQPTAAALALSAILLGRPELLLHPTHPPTCELSPKQRPVQPMRSLHLQRAPTGEP